MAPTIDAGEVQRTHLKVRLVGPALGPADFGPVQMFVFREILAEMLAIPAKDIVNAQVEQPPELMPPRGPRDGG